MISSSSFTTLVSIVVCVSLSQLSTTHAQVFSCAGRLEGLYRNPNDCSGYYQCANGVATPYVRQCAPGSLYDEIQRTCLRAADVFCNNRPLNNNIGRLNFNVNQGTFPGTLITPNVIQGTGGRVVYVQLYTGFGGPVLRTDQCAEVGRLLTNYIRYLVSGYDTTCASNPNCQQSLPVFQVQCLATAG